MGFGEQVHIYVDAVFKVFFDRRNSLTRPGDVHCVPKRWTVFTDPRTEGIGVGTPRGGARRSDATTPASRDLGCGEGPGDKGRARLAPRVSPGG